MKALRNKKKQKNSKSEESFDIEKNCAEERDNDIDNIIQDKSITDDDYSDDSSLSDHIERKIDSIIDKSKNNLLKDENIDEDMGKSEKKKKQKYDKKIIKKEFNDFFDANAKKIDDYYEVNYPGLNDYELKIDMYSDLYKKIIKKEIFPSLLGNKVEEVQNLNNLNEGNLFQLIYELFYQNINVFLYGFGTKMELIYDFIDIYREKFYSENDIPLYIISINLNNPEMNFKVILNKIQSCLEIEFEKIFRGKYNNFAKEIIIDYQLTQLQSIYNQIRDKYNNIDNKKTGKNKESENNNNSSNSSSDREESVPNEEIPKKKADLDKKLPFKILLIINNIGSTIGQSKTFHQNLSELSHSLYFVNLLVTSDNLMTPFYWTLEAKEKFRFCFLKYNTHKPYDIEIDENNSIKIGNNLKGGFGLKEIFSSFTENQKSLMKEIAKLTLKGDHEHLTPKGLVNYFIETGIGIATDIQKLESLILEAIDHEIIELKVSNENNKEIYKMNLERSIIEKIAEGEFL